MRLIDQIQTCPLNDPRKSHDLSILNALREHVRRPGARLSSDGSAISRSHGHMEPFFVTVFVMEN